MAAVSRQVTNEPRVFAGDGALLLMRPAAFVAPKTKAAEPSVRPLGEIKILRSLIEAHVFDFDELAPFFFFFFVAITLLLSF